MFDWLSEKLDNILVWIVKTLQSVIESLLAFLNYVFVSILDLVMGAISALVGSIQAPEFLSNGLNQLFDLFPDWLNFFFGVTGLGGALAVIGAGVAFRLLRKIFTLGQW